MVEGAAHCEIRRAAAAPADDIVIGDDAAAAHSTGFRTLREQRRQCDGAAHRPASVFAEIRLRVLRLMERLLLVAKSLLIVRRNHRSERVVVESILLKSTGGSLVVR